ncbi:MAG: heavy metal-binding domain-containing protein [Bacteroidales bacterium]
MFIAGEIQIWTCSMHPGIKQEKPGKCPICAMDLIPLVSMSSGNEHDSHGEVLITASAAALADVQTSIVSGMVPSRTVWLQGKVTADRRHNNELLTARFGGE